MIVSIEIGVNTSISMLVSQCFAGLESGQILLNKPFLPIFVLEYCVEFNGAL